MPIKIEPDKLREKEILSPEGVEELIVYEYRFLITLTGGGKYRTYGVNNGKVTPHGVHETLEAAKREVARAQVFVGALELDPKRAIDMMFGGRDDKDKA
jgi:hypothetical protein